MNNLTSDKKATYPLLLWISMLTFIATILSMFIFQGSYTENQFNFLWVLGVISIISTIISSRFPSCKTCGERANHDKFSVYCLDVEKLIEQHSLKKPYQYESMKKSTDNWTFHILTCENCDYKQVVNYSPDDFGD